MRSSSPFAGSSSPEAQCSTGRASCGGRRRAGARRARVGLPPDGRASPERPRRRAWASPALRSSSPSRPRAPRRSRPACSRWHVRSGASRCASGCSSCCPSAARRRAAPILEATVRVAEPRPEQDGFDERAWLARQGIHVVLEASSWRQVGRRGGIAGFGDALRDRIERAVGRGTSGVRRGVVLGVVLGEDEGLRPRRAGRLPRIRALPPARRLGSERRVPRRRRSTVSPGSCGCRERGASSSILVAITAYVLAVGWQPSVDRARRRRCAGVARLARRATARSLALPRARSARPRGVDADVGARAGLPALVRRRRGDLRRRAAAPGRARRLSRARRARGRARRRACVRSRDRADRPAPLRPGAALHRGRRTCSRSRRRRSSSASGSSPPSSIPSRRPAAAGLGALAGWAAAWLELVARVVADLPGAQIGSADDARARGARGRRMVRGSGGEAARRRFPVRESDSSPSSRARPCSPCRCGSSTRPPPAWDPPAGLRVTFLDVGQGDSTLLETPSARVLVDEGPPEANVAGQLARMGIHSLSAIVLTHPQRDHVGGAADVIRRLRVARGARAGARRDRARERGGARRCASARRAGRGRPSRYDVPRRRARARTCCGPRTPGRRARIPNQNAVVLIASYGETDVYLSADAESDVTARLPLRAVEIMKVAHHGSEDPGLADELRTLRPRIAVISCGRNNDYGHPRPRRSPRSRARRACAVYRTDEDGRVVVESDGRHLTVRSDR